MDDKVWETDPFPLVPATWMVMKWRCGCDRWLSRANVLYSPSLYAPAPIFSKTGVLLNKYVTVSL